MREICWCGPCFVCVPEKHVAPVETNAQAKSNEDFVGPGLHTLLWPIQSIPGALSLQIQSRDVTVRTKTHDNVFVSVVITIIFKVDENAPFNAYYKMTDSNSQLSSWVEDAVRGEVPSYTLDSFFESKDRVANRLKERLTQEFSDYGYVLLDCLVTDIDVEYKVKASMNEINATRRLRVATEFKAEGEKIMQLKAAEAQAESKYLNGQGIAGERKAIIDGLKDSVVDFSTEVPGTTNKDVMDLILLTQYFDMLKEVGACANTTKLMMHHGPSAIKELKSQLHKQLK